MMLQRPAPGRTGDEGFILIAVLWILASLATMASICAVYSAESAVASRVPDDRLQAEAAIRAGVALAAFQALRSPKPSRPARGAFQTNVGLNRVSVQFVSEASRIDLNEAPKELLSGLFVALGVGKSNADDYADRIVGWRQKAGSDTSDVEAAAYKQAGLGYPPRGGPFNDALELRLVLGLPPAVVDRIMPHVTVYSARPQLDVVTADPETLAALPNLTPDILSDVLQARAAGADGKTLIAKLGPAGAGATFEPSEAIRTAVVVAMPDGRRVQAEIVFRLTDGKPAPFDVLYWRDDFDGPMRQG